ncbi:MAG: glycosyltransferase family 2 protein [Verrucomicrobia subdivision 3 bacterium]|nr:glycosyltransferase family 2 protein [Limisphaerales bacterium]
MSEAPAEYAVSVVILNYNAKQWAHRCIESLTQQTIFDRIQIIIADNASADGSDKLFEELISGWKNAIFVQNGGNIGFAAGNNRGAHRASGRYLFFLNPDLWLEPDCVEQLYRTAEENKVAAAGPYVMDYDDDAYQSFGAVGFDVCSLGVPVKPGHTPRELFMTVGFVFIRRDVFERLGSFNEQFFLYGEESDLSWKIWISGERLIPGPKGRVHHRGAVSVNPKGGTQMVEIRTSDLKRSQSNLNNVLVLLYHAQHILLLLLFPLLLLLLVESLMGMVLARRWSFLRATYLGVLLQLWRLRSHIAERRRFVHSLRRRGDFWMLRFFTWRLAHWEDFKRVLKLGLPKINK